MRITNTRLLNAKKFLKNPPENLMASKVRSSLGEVLGNEIALSQQTAL